jgi:hypothetical protein
MTGKDEFGVAMVGYAFMGAAHSQAWRTVNRAFDLPVVAVVEPDGADPEGHPGVAFRSAADESLGHPDGVGSETDHRFPIIVVQVVKMSSGRNAETRKLGTSTSWLILRSTATLQIAYAC